MSVRFPQEIRRGNNRVTIYQNSNSNRPSGKDFKIAWYDAQRKRRFSSCATYAEARAESERILCAIERGNVRVMDLDKADLEAYSRAITILQPTGVSLESACREFVEASKLLKGTSIVLAAQDYAKRHHQNIIRINVDQLVGEFLAAKRNGERTYLRQRKPKLVSDRYLYDLEIKLKAFANRFRCSISGVKSADVDQFIKDIDGGGRTKNNYLAAIASLIEFAKFKKYLPRDYTLLDDVAGMAEDDFEIEIYTPEELVKLLAGANRCLQPIVALQAFAGLRTAEVLRLDWSEIRLPSRCIEIKSSKSKTKSRRLAPIPDNLAAWLNRFPNSSGQVWPHSSAYVYECFYKAANAAGIVWRHNALRHSFCSYRTAHVQNLNQVALEAGHSVQILQEHYRELVTPEQAAQWFAIVPKAAANIIPLAAAIS
jgi:integrase